MISIFLYVLCLNNFFSQASVYFCQRARQVIQEMISFDTIHLIGTFFNPKTRRMKDSSARQMAECIEYVKSEMQLFDVDQHVKSSPNQKPVSLSTNISFIYRTDFYLNLEIDHEDYADQHGSSKASSYTLEIDLHFKHGADKMTSLTNSGQENEEYNRLSFWKMKHVSYPIVAMVATRVLTVLATRAAVEREFSFTGNIITQKYSKSSSDTVNGILFNHSYNNLPRVLIYLNFILFGSVQFKENTNRFHHCYICTSSTCY